MKLLFKGLAALVMLGAGSKIFAPLFAGAGFANQVLRAGCPEGHWVGGKKFLIHVGGGSTVLGWALGLLVVHGDLRLRGTTLALFQPELEELQDLLNGFITAVQKMSEEDAKSICKKTAPAVSRFIKKLEKQAAFSNRKVWV